MVLVMNMNLIEYRFLTQAGLLESARADTYDQEK
jgi:hypothetical protein